MKKILLIPDVRGWAYDIIAKNIKKFSKNFIYDIVYEEEISKNKVKIDFDNYDLVFWFYWASVHRVGPKKIKNFTYDKVCVGIHSYNSWQKRGMNSEELINFCSNFIGIAVPSEALYEDIGVSNVFLTRTGFDPSLFSPSNDPKVYDNKFLWAGNISKQNHGDIKGVHDVILPVFNKRKDVKLLTQTKDKCISNDKMSEFYHSGDVLICASSSEGGPMPVLEALACGIPVISTRVGWSRYLIKDGYNGFLFDKNESGLSQAINLIRGNSHRYSQMSKNAVKSVSDRTWSNTINDYESFFNTCISKRKKYFKSYNTPDLHRDGRKKLGLKSGVFAVGVLGNLLNTNEEVKNTLDIFNDLRKKDISSRPMPSKLYIFNLNPKFFSHINNYISKNNLNDNIFIISDNLNLKEKLAAMDSFLYFSKKNIFPKDFILLMLLRRPIVSYNTLTIKNIYSKDLSKLLFFKKSEAVRMLETLASSGKLRSSYGKISEEKIKNYLKK